MLRRLAPWLILFEVLRAGRDHWDRLDPGDRARVSALMRRTQRQPAQPHRRPTAATCATWAAGCGSAAWGSRWRRRPSSDGASVGAGRASLGVVPRSPALRAVKWAVLFDALVVAREHWEKLTPGERAHLAALLRKSRARPGNLTPGERRDVRRLAAKLDLPTLGRNLAPVARRLRPRPR